MKSIIDYTNKLKDFFAQKQALSDEVETRATHGAHNLMPFPYYNKNGRTNGNILFLVDEDGIITASKIDAGSSTMDGWFNLASATQIANTALKVGKTYILSGGTSSNPLFIQFRDSSQQTIGSPISCTGSEVSVTIPNNAAYFDSYYHVTNATSPVTLKPIICDEKDAYTEFTPYAMTNRELTKSVLLFKDVACAVTVGNFATISDSDITADHVVIDCQFDNPAAIRSDVTWTTSNGSLVLNGTCMNATNATLILARKGN